MKAPMLAAQDRVDVSTLRYPLYALPKLDGCRALLTSRGPLSRSLKKFANRFVNERFSSSALNGLDGELILGDPTDPDVFHRTSEALRTIGGEPDIQFYAFDLWNSKDTFETRYFDLRCSGRSGWWDHIRVVDAFAVVSAKRLLEYEQEVLDLGYEGLILRSPDGLYKHGRATLKEGTMLKLKRFKDAEAVCVGYYEMMHNANKAFKDKLGRTKRTSHKENKVPLGTLGGLILKDEKNFPGVTFECGTGPCLTKAGRARLWSSRKELAGTRWKYSFQRHGSQERPRSPTLIGLRITEDA